VFTVSAILLGKIPSSLQLLGLIFGICGALTLTIFEEIKSFWRNFTQPREGQLGTALTPSKAN
jgi:hypothetical protein